MKLLVGLLILFLPSSSILSQDLLKRIADGTCICAKEVNASYKSISSNQLDSCLVVTLTYYESQLKEEYGEDKFGNDKDFTYELGVKVGKILLVECDEVLSTYVNEERLENDRVSELSAAIVDHKNKGEYKEVINAYSELIRLQPSEFIHYNDRGAIYYQLDDYYSALADFMRACELKPTSINANYNLGRCFDKLGKNELALKFLNRSSDLGNSSCEVHNMKGILYSRDNDFEKSRDSYLQAIDCDSTNHMYYFNLGYLYYLKEDYQNANTYFEKSYSIDPTDYNLVSYLGNTYNSLDLHDQALKMHRIHSENDQNNYVPYYNIGYSYYSLGSYDKAIEYLSQAVNLDSTDTDIYYYLAKSHENLDQIENAEEYYDLMIDTDTDNPNLYDYRAAFHHKNENYEKAIHDYTVSLSLYPDDCNIHIKLGSIYEILGEKDKSIVEYAKAQNMGCEKE